MVNNANYSSKHLEEINLYTYINWEGNKIHSLLSSPKKSVVKKKQNSNIFHITCFTSTSHLTWINKHNNILQL